MMSPRVYALVEQVHLDVTGCILMVCIHGATRSFVRRGIRLNLGVCMRRLEELAAVDPCGLVDLREMQEHAQVVRDFQDAIGVDHVVLDGHVAREAVCVCKQGRLDFEGLVVFVV